MDIDPYSLRPMGDVVVVEIDPPPVEVNGISLVATAGKSVVCPDCGGVGCFPFPVFEEDGIKIARHVEVPCDKCKGAGRFVRYYDPVRKMYDRTALVISAGPGAQRCVRRHSDRAILRWKEGRAPVTVAPGDRVLLSRYAGYSGVSFFLDEEKRYAVVREFEILAVLQEAGEADQAASA